MFASPKKYGYTHEKYGSEEIISCPRCDSENVHEAVCCKECDKWIAGCDEEKYHYFDFEDSYGYQYLGYICNDCLGQRLEEILGAD